jgi:3-keto-5-aminohexanoate cleavage enzyme
VPVYPSIPSAGIGVGPLPTEAAQRFQHIEALAARGLLEFAVVDPGSVNFTTLVIQPNAAPAQTYLNPEAHVRYALGFAVRYGFHPAYAIYEPGFTRAGAALARAAGSKTPIYRLMFSQTFAYGFPPKPWALAAHLALLDEEAPGAPWMLAGLGVDIRPLAPETIRRGGHIRVGLEDAPFGCPMTNRALVEEAVALVRANGAEPATVAEMRAALAAVG